jgi:hypothetical protein
MSHHQVKSKFLKQQHQFQSGILCVSILSFFCIAFALTCAGAAAITSVIVNPREGTDSSSCGQAASPCKTIAFAVQNISASSVSLSPGIFNESTVSINSVASLVISGVPSATFFNCSGRLDNTGAAFLIVNSSVTITGISFENCFNPNSNGGAVSAYDSNVVVSHCSFVKCSAASGGAIAAMAPMRRNHSLFLNVYNSYFFGNSANGGLSGCPSDAGQSNQPCSTWGGAVAAFDMLDVTVSGCRMEANKARATVPTTSLQYTESRNAVSGGGCISVLFYGNATGSAVSVSGNTFEQCVVDVSRTYYVRLGNGYGGAVSVYFGLFAGLRQLDVSFFNLALHDNVFTGCEVNVSPILGGNAYGGGVSVYVGGYSSVYIPQQNGPAVAEVGETVLRNASIILKNSRFSSCTSRRFSLTNVFGGSVYGGSFSFYVGAYAWSASVNSLSNSSSTCGATSARGVSVGISDAPCSNCRALTTGGKSSILANAYGGSMSVMHVGAYALSQTFGEGSPSSSTCGATSASGVSVGISDAPCSNCSALTTSGCDSNQANAYGGSMSVVHVGAHAWSLTNRESSPSSSTCGATSASGVSVSISDAPCSNCSALTISVGSSLQANAFGGSMSVVHVGAHAWIYTSGESSPSSSMCGATSASGVSVNISDAPCSNCRALTSSGIYAYQANAYGGSMSVVHVGAHAWIYTVGESSPSNSTCEATSASGVSVGISDAPCSNCSALTTSISLSDNSYQANAYGGSMSVVHVGAHAWSATNRESSPSSSTCGATSASGVSVGISDAPCSNCSALTISGGDSLQANAFGGSMSVVYVSAHAWSYGQAANSSSRSTCGATSASGVIVNISDAPCSNCSALTTSGGLSFQANAYGGSMSVVHVGANAWSSAFIGAFGIFSISFCYTTRVTDLSVFIADSTMLLTKAVSSKHRCSFVFAFMCNGFFFFGPQILL